MNIAIIGASGTIGQGFVEHFLKKSKTKSLYLFSRSAINYSDTRIIHHFIDIENEKSIEKAAQIIPDEVTLDYIIVATGVLSTDNIMPERSIKELSYDKFNKVLAINTIGPALIGKHFIQKLHKDNRSVFAVLSARLGSISDNNLGGWYSYRCSKSALNMIIKNMSIEIRYKTPKLIIVGMHPGTVKGKLSDPFSRGISKDKIFDASYSVSKMIDVITSLTIDDSGKVFAWDGKEIGF
ncbi:MAG: SDR family NAD(P)-dependent oxidoreductase [Rickettsiaceae bacterium]|nr:SDR family NAD(P)-dependent oxidoreductase [Rickettsiaceae bacterium]